MSELVKIEVPVRAQIVEFLRQVAEKPVGEYFVYPGAAKASTLSSVASKYRRAFKRKFSVRKVDGKVAVGVLEIIDE